jgi:4-hydroxybenzoate polyprenyltransferase
MTNSDAKPLDAVPRSWVDGAPVAARPYLRLMRLDRPIGSWLLFWPCVFGLALGAAMRHRAFLAHGRDWWLLVLFAAGTLVMRGAGCTYNDIVDRDIDAKVARTRARPIPSGAVSVGQAWMFLAAQCTVGLVILLMLNPFAIAVGAVSLVPVAAYPFMKRITWWPQAWLGLTFNWGVLLGCAAAIGSLPPAAFVIYVAGIFWTLGYDTIYALQDIEDDALVGVKSTARLFGEHAPTWIFLFYAATLGFLAIAGLSAGLGRPFALMLIFVGVHFLWQVRRLEIDRPETTLKLFRANRDAGALMALALVMATWRY